ADTKGADSTYTRGFHLAGVDIPYPTGAYVQKTGTTSLSDSAALCWVQRCTAEGKVAWVLSLVNGSCPAKKDISCGGSEEEGAHSWVKVDNGNNFGNINGSDQNVGECYVDLNGALCQKHSESEQACRNACFNDQGMAEECRTAKSPLALQGGSCSSPGSTKSCTGLFGYLVDGAQLGVNRNVCICGYAHHEYICK
ncbi:MAG: hypothetical protein PUC11_07900, partial [Elusimicrobia bacterium]|nr:hypothetical protein [Elusimicrobiota bacterium]